MKIGFDVSQTTGEKAGCGYTAEQLIHHLALLDRENEYLLYPTFYNYHDPSFYKIKAPNYKNFKIHFKEMSFNNMLKGWESKMGDRTHWLGSPDIIHSNNFSCYKDHKAKIVYTLYDVVPLVYPEFTTEENRLVCFEGIFNASIFADHIIAISVHTKRAFLKYFPHYPENRVTVVYLDVRPTINSIIKPYIAEKILKKYNLSKEEYWLGVGTIEPRKNYKLLIEAYSSLNDSRPLVIAGGKGWLNSPLAHNINELGIQNKIKFLGYVTDEELSVLYNKCLAFVYPSHYEGFGLPVLEAMRCGAPVITSNTSSLPEVGGDAVLYIDPSSRESLINNMQLIIQNSAFRHDLKTKSLKQSEKFSWNEAAEKTLSVYKKTLIDNQWFEK